MKKIFTLIVLISCLVTKIHAQSVSLAEVSPEEVKIQGFSLSTDGSVKIKGAGGVFSDDWKLLLYYGWIINADSREVVWHLYDYMSEMDKREADGFIDFETKVDLKKGDYELYFVGMVTNRNWNNDGYRNEKMSGFDDALNWVFGHRDKIGYRPSMKEDLFIQLEGKGLELRRGSELFDKKTSNAVVSTVRTEDNNQFKKGFTLDKETTLRVYALGEGSKGEMYDYAWIMNATTRERVFEMDYRNAEHAGGAKKNLKIDRTITLPAGSYLLNYSSDDSHSFEKWNALPPDDLQFWGVSVWPSKVKDKANFVTYIEPKTMTPLVSLTKARDNGLLSKGISIKKEMNVRIYCLGEEANGDEMADYGWIVDASSREKVWKMKAYRSKHGGGADKNRSVEEVISLEPGDYIVYYSTDGSHSFNDWNSSKPYEPNMWGITLWATQDSDLKNVAFFHPDEYKNKNELVAIAMVGDRELIKKIFSLDKKTTVRVIGLGEGSFGEMQDFGFIKDMDSGRVVWEMDYRDSEHGGGARKNREFNESIELEKGTYKVYFESDGSHSYRRWNDDPPTNQELWGITVLRD